MNRNENEKVDLEAFANMAGFPVELVRKELFQDSSNEDEISLADLRKAMLAYIDSTMLESDIASN